MAKGDPNRTQNLIDSQGAQGSTRNDQLLNNFLIPQNQTFQNNYTNAQATDTANQSDIMNRYKTDVIPGYQQMAKTGGYSPTDLASMRAQSLAPSRGIFANAMNDVNRQKSLQGGYSPGYGTLMSRMARDQSTGLSAANTGVEANMAQMVQQGKLAGMAGQANAVGGMNTAYGTTPGATSTAGNQLLDSTGQLNTGYKNANDYGLSLIDAQRQKGNMKGGIDWATIVKAVGTGATIAAMASDRNLKKNIFKVDDHSDIVNKYKKLPIYNWTYRGDDKPHIGPMAQDFKKIFGKGDGKTISLVDVLGTTLALNKAVAEKM